MDPDAFTSPVLQFEFAFCLILQKDMVCKPLESVFPICVQKVF